MKFVLLALFLALLLLTSSLQHTSASTLANFTSQITVSDGSSIQAAINNAIEGSTILVKNGIYREQIIVNKSVSLIGESVEGVVLDGNGNYTYIINIVAENVNLHGFTIVNASTTLGSTSIHVFETLNVVIQNCKIDIGYHGVTFTNSSNCRLFNNKISRNYIGIQLRSSSKNNILNGNSMVNNTIGIRIDSSTDNIIFHCNFINNTYSYFTDGSENHWDNGYPSGGNYWSDYPGQDQKRGSGQNITGSDGLGDSPYPFADVSLDNLPYFYPVSIELYSRDNSTYYFLISSNLTIVDFNFHAENETSINFNVRGINGTQGCFRVIVPRSLLLINSIEQWIVKANNNPITPLLEEEADNFFLYFCFNLEQEIETVRITPVYATPKSSPFPFILVFVILLLLIFIFCMMFYRRHRYQHKHSSSKNPLQSKS